MKDMMASPWAIDEQDFPLNAALAEKLEFVLGYAVLAPSSHNTQPWLFRIRGECIELFADRTRSLKVSDPGDRELVISCGAALFHLKLALRHFNLFRRLELLPDPADLDLLARVWVGTEGSQVIEDTLMFHAIPKRRTNRQRFQADPLPPRLLAELHTAAFHEGAWLHYVEAEDERLGLAELVAQGDRKQWSDKRFRLELAAWVHSNHSAARDGIPGYAQDVDDMLSYMGPLVVRTFDLGDGQAAKNTEIALHSPALAVIGTSEDTPRDWLLAGQALAHVLLRARVEDVWASFLNQPIEVPELRSQLVQLLDRCGSPQLILRLGFGSDVKPTPRRHVDEVLI